MKISESLTIGQEDQMVIQKALAWLSTNYSAATRGIQISSQLEQNGSDRSALLTLTVQSILYSWSKQADVVIETVKPLNQLAIYNQLEAALLAALAKETN